MSLIVEEGGNIGWRKCAVGVDEADDGWEGYVDDDGRKKMMGSLREGLTAVGGIVDASAVKVVAEAFGIPSGTTHANTSHEELKLSRSVAEKDFYFCQPAIRPLAHRPCHPQMASDGRPPRQEQKAAAILDDPLTEKNLAKLLVGHSSASQV